MGFSQPVNPDTGDVFYPALTSNWAQVNNHTHDGITSQLLAITSQNISSGSWTAKGGVSGIYTQTITLPTLSNVNSAFNYDTCVITFKLSSGEQVYPSVTRISSTQYSLDVSDNTLNLVAYYR